MDQVASLTATCNQMNAPCEQLRSKKVPHWTSPTPRDVGQVLRKKKTVPCSCYGALLSKEQFLETAQSPIYGFLAFFTHRGISTNLLQDLLDISQ